MRLGFGLDMEAGGGSAALIGGTAVGATAQPIPGGGDYILSWGDDFGSLDIVSPAAPKGKFFPTRQYLPGARGSDTLLGTMYDSDPLHTGHNDSNRGVAVGLSNMSVANSAITLQARTATAGEKAHFSPTDAAINGGVRSEISAIIHGSGAVAYYPTTNENVIEFRAKFSATNPSSFHPDLWSFSIGPTNNNNEWDFEGDGTNTYYDQNLWTGGSFVGTFYGAQTAHDGAYHTFAFVLRNGGDTEWWVDGVKKANVTADSNTWARLQSWITSAHVYNGVWKLGTYSKAEWDGDADGASLTLDWIRVWRRATAAHYRPLVAVSDLNVSFLGSGSIVMPSVASLWGDGAVTEFLQVIPFEENEPGGSHTVGLALGAFPTGISYASRILSVDFSTDTTGLAGRVHFALYGYKADGSTCEPARFVVNRGPRVTATTINATDSVALSFDLYTVCDVGRLTPKILAVTGLPAGFSFSPSTGLITGTSAVQGTTSINVTVTNSQGQAVTTAVNFVVNAAGGGAFSTDFAGTNLTDITALGFTRVDGTTNQMRINAANQCRTDDVGSPGTAYTAPSSGSLQHFAQATVKTVGAGGPGVAVRCQDSQNWVYVSWSTTGYNLNKRVGGTITALGSRAGTAVIGDVVRIEIDSSHNARLLVNGSQAIAPVAIAAAGLTSMKPGLISRLVAKDPFIDDFSCGPF